MTFRFEHPELLYALWVLPLLLTWRLYLLWWAKRQRAIFANHKALKRLAPQRDATKSWIKFALRAFALAALIIAAANPQQGGKVENQTVTGAQLVFALDVSRSMLVEDVQPNRLERARQLINRMLPQMANDQVGLIAFAGKAFPVVPMTPDKSSLAMQMRNIDPTSISAQGTNFSAMISLAASLFDQTIPSDRILIVIGDGEDHEGNWKDRVDVLRKLDVRVFTVGIGTEKGGLIPERNSGGRVTGYVKDETGSAVVSRLEPKTLQELADFGDGTYHYLSSLQGGERFLKDVIAGLGRSEFERKVFTTYQSQYQWPLALALFLLCLEWLMFEKKTRWLQRLQSIGNPNIKDNA